jgi:hypothetical protein
VAWLRADWFVSTALQEPHYGRLLHLPSTLAELEAKLGLDSAANLRGERLMRAALSPADRAGCQRVLDRHALPEGRAFWRTHDRLAGKDAPDLFAQPLGPLVEAGQVLFHLPNGMPAFLSVNADGRRQTEAQPPETLCPGTPSLHLGRSVLSCVTCHVQGPHAWPGGSPRPAGPFEPAVAEKVARLYADEDTLKQRLQADRGLVQRVRGEAGGLDGTADPVATVALRYLATPVAAALAARELDLDDVEELKQLIHATPLLAIDRKLKPLADGKTVSRAVWAHDNLASSPFREVAYALKLGGALRAP